MSSSRSGVNRYAKKRLVDKYVKPEARKATRVSPRGQVRTQPPQQQPTRETPVDKSKSEKPIVDISQEPETPVSRAGGVGEVVVEDRIGVDEESDDYKKGVAGFFRGVGSPTAQIAQVPMDIIQGVPAEDQKMPHSWMDLLLLPALGPMAASGKDGLGITTDRWYSPFRNEMFDHPSVPEFLRPDPTDKRGFFEGMGANIGNIGAVIQSPTYHHTVWHGNEQMGLPGFDQAGKEFSDYPEYYIGSVIGEIPYFVISPLLAARVSTKVTATAVRIAGKPFANPAYIKTTDKLKNTNKAVAESIKKEATTINTMEDAGFDKTTKLKPLDTKPVDRSFKVLKEHIGIEVQLRKKNVSELKSQLDTVHKPDDKRVLVDMINREESTIVLRNMEIKTLKDEFNISVKNVKDKESKFNVEPSKEAFDEYTSARKQHLLITQGQVFDRFNNAEKIADMKIASKYNALRDAKVSKLEGEIRLLKQKTYGYDKEGAPQFSPYNKKIFERKQKELETLQSDDIPNLKVERDERAMKIKSLKESMSDIKRLAMTKGPITHIEGIVDQVGSKKQFNKLKAKIEKKDAQLKRLKDDMPEVSSFERIASKIEDSPDAFNRSIRSKFTKKWTIKDQQVNEKGLPIEYKDGIEVELPPTTNNRIANIYTKLSGGVKARYSRTAKRHAEHLTSIKLLDTLVLQSESDPSRGALIDLSRTGPRANPEELETFLAKHSEYKTKMESIGIIRKEDRKVPERLIREKKALESDLNNMMVKWGSVDVEYNPTTVIAEKSPVNVITSDYLSPALVQGYDTGFQTGGWVKKGSVRKADMRKYDLKEATIENIREAQKNVDDTGKARLELSLDDGKITDETHTKLNILDSDGVLVFGDADDPFIKSVGDFAEESNIKIEVVQSNQSNVITNDFIRDNKISRLHVVGKREPDLNIQETMKALEDAESSLGSKKRMLDEHMGYESKLDKELRTELIKIMPQKVRSSGEHTKWLDAQVLEKMKSLEKGELEIIGTRSFSGKNPSGMTMEQADNLNMTIGGEIEKVDKLESVFNEKVKTLSESSTGMWDSKSIDWVKFEGKKKGGGPIKLESPESLLTKYDWEQTRIITPAKPDAVTVTEFNKNYMEFSLGYSGRGADVPEFITGTITRKRNKELADSRAGFGPDSVWSQKGHGWLYSAYMPFDPETLSMKARGRSNKYGSGTKSTAVVRFDRDIKEQDLNSLIRMLGLVGTGGKFFPVEQTMGVKRVWRPTGKKTKKGRMGFRSREQVQYGWIDVEGRPVYSMGDITTAYGPRVAEKYKAWEASGFKSNDGNYIIDLGGFGKISIKDMHLNRRAYQTKGEESIGIAQNRVDDRMEFMEKQLDSLKKDNESLDKTDNAINSSISNRINDLKTMNKNLLNERKQNNLDQKNADINRLDLLKTRGRAITKDIKQNEIDIKSLEKYGINRQRGYAAKLNKNDKYKVTIDESGTDVEVKARWTEFSRELETHNESIARARIVKQRYEDELVNLKGNDLQEAQARIKQLDEILGNDSKSTRSHMSGIRNRMELLGRVNAKGESKISRQELQDFRTLDEDIDQMLSMGDLGRFKDSTVLDTRLAKAEAKIKEFEELSTNRSVQNSGGFAKGKGGDYAENMLTSWREYKRQVLQRKAQLDTGTTPDEDVLLSGQRIKILESEIRLIEKAIKDTKEPYKSPKYKAYIKLRNDRDDRRKIVHKNQDQMHQKLMMGVSDRESQRVINKIKINELNIEIRSLKNEKSGFDELRKGYDSRIEAIKLAGGSVGVPRGTIVQFTEKALMLEGTSPNDQPMYWKLKDGKIITQGKVLSDENALQYSKMLHRADSARTPEKKKIQTDKAERYRQMNERPALFAFKDIDDYNFKNNNLSPDANLSDYPDVELLTKQQAQKIEFGEHTTDVMRFFDDVSTSGKIGLDKLQRPAIISRIGNMKLSAKVLASNKLKAVGSGVGGVRKLLQRGSQAEPVYNLGNPKTYFPATGKRGQTSRLARQGITQDWSQGRRLELSRLLGTREDIDLVGEMRAGSRYMVVYDNPAQVGSIAVRGGLKGRMESLYLDKLISENNWDTGVRRVVRGDPEAPQRTNKEVYDMLVAGMTQKEKNVFTANIVKQYVDFVVPRKEGRPLSAYEARAKQTSIVRSSKDDWKKGSEFDKMLSSMLPSEFRPATTAEKITTRKKHEHRIDYGLEDSPISDSGEVVKWDSDTIRGFPKEQNIGPAAKHGFVDIEQAYNMIRPQRVQPKQRIRKFIVKAGRLTVPGEEYSSEYNNPIHYRFAKKTEAQMLEQALVEGKLKYEMLSPEHKKLVDDGVAGLSVEQEKLWNIVDAEHQAFVGVRNASPDQLQRIEKMRKQAMNNLIDSEVLRVVSKQKKVIQKKETTVKVDGKDKVVSEEEVVSVPQHFTVGEVRNMVVKKLDSEVNPSIFTGRNLNIPDSPAGRTNTRLVKAINDITPGDIELSLKRLQKSGGVSSGVDKRYLTELDKKINKSKKTTKETEDYTGVEEVWSGGQDGVDTKGLEIAKSLNIKTGGYMPKNYQTITQGSKPSPYPPNATLDQKAMIDDLIIKQGKYGSDEKALRDLDMRATMFGFTAEPINPASGNPFTLAEYKALVGDTEFNKWTAQVKLYEKHGGQKGIDDFHMFAIEKDAAVKGGAIIDSVSTSQEIGKQRARKFGLKEDKGDYKSRTFRNAKETDATVYYGMTDGKGTPTSGGGKDTLAGAKAANKPIIVNPTESELTEFLIKNKVKKLNVSGSRYTDSRVNSLEHALVQSSGAYKGDIWEQSLFELNTRLSARAMKSSKDVVVSQRKSNWETIEGAKPENKVDELLDVIGEGRNVGPVELRKWYRKYIKENHPDRFKSTYGRKMNTAEDAEFKQKKNAYESLMKGVKAEDKTASMKQNKTVYRTDDTISKQFKARTERVSEKPEPDMDTWYEMQNIILRKRDDLTSKAKSFEEYEDLVAERKRVAEVKTWTGNPKNDFSGSDYTGPSEQLLELEYKQSKLGKDLDMISGFHEGRVSLGRMGVEGLDDTYVSKMTKKWTDKKGVEQETRVIRDESLNKGWISVDGSKMPISYSITPTGLKYNYDDLLKIAKKRQEGEMGSVTISDMKSAETFVSKSLQNQAKNNKFKKNPEFRYMEIQQDGSFRVDSDFDTSGSRTMQPEDYQNQGVIKKGKDDIKNEVSTAMKEMYPSAFDEYLDINTKVKYRERINQHEKRISDLNDKEAILKSDIRAEGKTTTTSIKQLQLKQVIEDRQLSMNDKLELEKKIRLDNEQMTKVSNRRVKTMDIRQTQESNMFDRGIYGVMSGNIMASAYAQKSEAQNYDTSLIQSVEPQSNIFMLSQDIIQPATKAVIGGIKASAFEVSQNVRNVITPITGQSIFQQDAQAQARIVAQGIDQITFGQLREGLVRPTAFNLFPAQQQLVPKLDPFLQARRVNFQEAPIVRPAPAAIGRIQPMAPYFPPTIITQYTPPKRRYKRDKWKKKKTYWEVPEYWFQPGYWGGKDQLGPGYRVFSGSEPKSIRRKERKKNLDGTLPKFNLR